MKSLLVPLVKKLLNPFKIVTLLFRLAAEGSLGPQVKAAYWWLAGHKSWVIAIVTAVGAFLVQLGTESPADCESISCNAILKILQDWGPVIIAALGASALDDALRQEPPKPDTK